MIQRDISKISISDNEFSVTIIDKYSRLVFDDNTNKYGSGFSNNSGNIEIIYENILFNFDYHTNSLKLNIQNLYIPYTIYERYINKKAFLTIFSKKLDDIDPKEIYTIEGTISISNLVYDIIDKSIYFKYLSFSNNILLEKDNHIFDLIDFLKCRDNIGYSKYIIIKIRVE